jgi:hypothetical protein
VPDVPCLFVFPSGRRNGLSVDRDILKRLLRMLVSIGTYGDRFEVPFLVESKRFFREEGMALMTGTGGSGAAFTAGGSGNGDAGCDPAGYLIHAEKRIQEASDMVNRYGHSVHTDNHYIYIPYSMHLSCHVCVHVYICSYS